MKRILTLIIGLFLSGNGAAQNLEPEMVYPDTLRSSQDSFYVNSPKFDKIWSFIISKKDTLNLGTSGYKGVSMTIWTDIDTIRIPHVNYPLRQLVKIPISSPNDTGLCIIRFQQNTSNFTDEYAEKQKNKYDIQILETYELANIALYLSNCSRLTGNHPKTDYTKRVEEYFAPYLNHKLIQVLNNNCKHDKFWSTYYGFRENSICFSFDDKGYLNYNTPYKQVYWDNTYLNGGQFRNILYLVQGFANQSNFRKFFLENKDYYNKLVDRQKELLPIKDMWVWLEEEFPQEIDSYKIVFSSLIDGSHFTQKFQKGFFKAPEFQECIMFINSPEGIDSNSGYSEKLKECLMSGTVFTEIDHNYVNPTSREHLNAIKDLIKSKDFWATNGAQQNYSSEYAIFNEYMTHSVFCLYVKEKYAEKVSKQVIDERVNLMNRRGYPQFEQFNNMLLEIMNENPKSIYDMYSEIIDEMKQIE